MMEENAASKPSQRNSGLRNGVKNKFNLLGFKYEVGIVVIVVAIDVFILDVAVQLCGNWIPQLQNGELHHYYITHCWTYKSYRRHLVFLNSGVAISNIKMRPSEFTTTLVTETRYLNTCYYWYKLFTTRIPNTTTASDTFIIVIFGYL